LKRNDFLFLCYVTIFLLDGLLVSIRNLKTGLLLSAITSAEMFSCEKNNKSKISLLNDTFHFIKKITFKGKLSLFKRKGQNSGIFLTHKAHSKSLLVLVYNYIKGKQFSLISEIDFKVPLRFNKQF